MKRVLIAAVSLVILAGCVSTRNLDGKTSDTTFVYKPNAAASGGPKLPVKVAVLPFNDGTEDFTRRGSVFSQDHYYNLAKTGIGGIITALTPDLWAKAFADDMAASGAFRAVRFVYSPSELLDEEFTLEGTLEKVYYAPSSNTQNKFALGLRVLRRADKKPIWEKGVSRTWNYAANLYEGCGMGVQCMVDRHHADANRVMREMFAEARADLVATLSGNRAGEGGLPSAASPTSRETESLEQTIDRILKEK